MAVYTSGMLYLGKVADMDPNETSNTYYNGDNAAVTIGGRTYGSNTDPLFADATRVSMDDISGDGRISFNDSPGTTETISYTVNGAFYSGKVDTAFIVNNVALTQLLPDGSTKTVTTSLRVMQDTNGNAFLMPPPQATAQPGEVAAVTTYPIISVKFPTSDSSFDRHNFSNQIFANRTTVPFQDGYVDGTSGNDSITAGSYADDDGDRIDSNDAILAGAGPNDDRVRAGAGNDTVRAGIGNDYVEGGDGNDRLFGEAGNDTLLGGDGTDSIDGGVGDDVMYGDDTLGTDTAGGADYIDGGTGNDTINGGFGNDTIIGGAGTDSILGGAGNDTIYGDATTTNSGAGAADWIDGGAGADSIFGGIGNDTIYGGAGNDTITGNVGNDLIYGGDGDDLLEGGGTDDGTGQNDTIYGDGGNDSINANIGDDWVDGGSGNDTISGGAGNDTISGGAGTDIINGNEGNDLIDAGGDNDYVTGGAGSDTIFGGAGNDRLFGGSVPDSGTTDAGDLIDGGAGDDTIDGGAGNDTLLGGDGTDSILGGVGNDSLNGGNGNDYLNGGDGMDRVAVGSGDQAHGGADADLMKIDPTQTGGVGTATVDGGGAVTAGGVDYDTLDSSAISSGVNVTFTGGEAGTLMSGTTPYSFSEIEHVVTGAGNDTVSGASATGGFSVDTGAGNDAVTGSVHNDTIAGGAGADTINGGAGNDRIDLGVNDGLNDTITLQDGSGNDTVSGFVAPTDTNNDGLVDTRGDQFDVSGLTNSTGAAVTAKDLLNGDGSVTSTTIGGVDGTLITFPNGETVFLPGIDPAALNTARELYYAGIPCFARGTLIETARGPVAIEALVAGDMVVTRDNGLQPIRWIGSRDLSAAELGANPNLRPIRIAAGALGGGLPRADLVVSPQHRVLVASNIAQKMFGTREVLVAAKQLCQIDGIDIAVDMASVEYFHMLFDQHEVVISNGAETESLYTGAEALKSVGQAARDEIFAIFPELRDAVDAPATARPLVSGRMGRKLAVRHAQNHKPLNG